LFSIASRSRRRTRNLDNEKNEMVEEFIQKYPNTQFILLADEAPLEASRVAKRDRIKVDHKSAFIQPLKRSGIRELARKWLEPTGLHSAQNVKAVLEKIRAFNLPGTAQVVSMVLWTIEREKSIGPVNEASLLQRFVESNLNRSDPSDIERGSIDFLIKEAFLSSLAYRMKEEDQQFVPKNDLLKEAIKFFEARSWQYDASSFIEELIAKGTLVQSSDADTQEVAFRFRCLAEYFTARHLSESAELVAELIASDRFINYVRELDVLTGLTRNHGDLLGAVLDKLTKHEATWKFDPLDRIPQFNSFKMKYAQAQALAITQQISLDVKGADATDAEINLLMDEMEDTTSVPAPTSLEENPHQTASPLHTYFVLTLLLSKMVRNNELVDNEALKLRALSKAIEAWCYFAMEGWLLFDDVTTGKGPEKIVAKFNSMDDKEKALVEFTAKCVMSAVISYIAQDAIGTDKLLVVINKSYDETESALTLKRLILLQVLLYLGFSAAKCPPETIDKAVDFIKSTKHPSTLTLLTLSLFGAYMNPFLGVENRKLLENLMAEVSIAQNARGWSAAQRNQAKSILIPRLQHLRKKVAPESDQEEGE
jgi:hypothetical protein